LQLFLQIKQAWQGSDISVDRRTNIMIILTSVPEDVSSAIVRWTSVSTIAILAFHSWFSRDLADMGKSKLKDKIAEFVFGSQEVI
jgi:hypothetical protein